MNSEIKENVKAKSTWMRGLFMLIFVVIYQVAEIVIGAVVVFQFLSNLFVGHANERLLRFGAQLSTFIYQVMRYLTYNTEERPFPFASWPEAPAETQGPVG